jgi:hypothetical protein
MSYQIFRSGFDLEVYKKKKAFLLLLKTHFKQLAREFRIPVLIWIRISDFRIRQKVQILAYPDSLHCFKLSSLNVTYSWQWFWWLFLLGCPLHCVRYTCTLHHHGGSRSIHHVANTSRSNTISLFVAICVVQYFKHLRCLTEKNKQLSASCKRFVALSLL